MKLGHTVFVDGISRTYTWGFLMWDQPWEDVFWVACVVTLGRHWRINISKSVCSVMKLSVSSCGKL